MGQADSVLGQRQNVCSDTILLWFGSFCICEGLSGTCSGWVGWEWEVATCWEEQFLRNFCCWNMHVWNPRPVLFPASSSVLTKKIVSELPWLSFGKASLRNSVGTMNLVLQAFMHALLTKRAACFSLCAVWLQHPEQNAPYLQTADSHIHLVCVLSKLSGLHGRSEEVQEKSSECVTVNYFASGIWLWSTGSLPCLCSMCYGGTETAWSWWS